jgi:hypothetical protein
VRLTFGNLTAAVVAVLRSGHRQSLFSISAAG